MDQEQKQKLAPVIASLPLTSGVYLMKDAKGKVIYVGKALSLRKRVQSYFRGSSNTGSPKTDRLVADIADIDYIATHSEAEALILEASLIKKYKTKYNIDQRDDKSYPYIEITGDAFPRVSVVRPRRKDPGSRYFGPYTQPKLIREALNIIRKIFPFRVCENFPKKECLDYHMQLCDAPCTGKISKKEYQANIKNIMLIIEGKKDVLLKKLKRQMEKLSQAQRYEDAGKIRDQLRALGALYSGTQGVNYYTEAEQLKRALDLPRLPQRIETFDISNIMGNQAVGAMVSFFNGKPDKKNYRRFRIKEVKGIDDFQMIAEVVKRRYRRLKKEKKIFPDLIVIDGGKGQLSAAAMQLRMLDVDVPVIGIAKKQEEIFKPGRRTPIRLPLDSLGLQLLQRIRDESHRFAITYHRLLRQKAVFPGKTFKRKRR
jgi:excinuclease ABC subunit C